MNVLSLFDGKSSGFTACELAGIEVDNYYSAEIDKYAIQVSNAIHPNQTRLGSVTEWREWDIDWSSIDMIFGGFPCQAWSMAGKQLGDKDERGMLFWTMLDIMKHVRHHNPKADFLIENVKMKKEFEEYITSHMEKELSMFECFGDEPQSYIDSIYEKQSKMPIYKILINSALVSAQNRNRYYWTSFPVTQPEDMGLVLADIIEAEKDNQVVFCDKSQTLLATIYKENAKSMVKRNKKGLLVASESNDFEQHTEGELHYRKLTPRECFRLQTVPEHYIDKILDCGVSNTQLYKIAGNGWTDEVIAHILGGIK